MKNKTIFIILITIFLIFNTSCNKEKEHNHTFESNWTVEGDYYYHKATCEHT